MKDRKKRKDKKQKKWNRDDCDFDHAGRLVIKNPALAKRLARAMSTDGGLIVNIPPQSRIEGMPDVNCQLPLIGCIVVNKRGCVDEECGDWIMRVIDPEEFIQGLDERAEQDVGGG